MPDDLECTRSRTVAGVTSLSIAATAERTGVSPHTLRYYERIGLIDPVGRDEGGRRVYTEGDLARVDFLRKLAFDRHAHHPYAGVCRAHPAGSSSEPARLALSKRIEGTF